ncbi:hypothetical protein G9C85_09460 [Halorubellus sp. JP-L1]|uniref:hypothetical protein n=1 Tax=Halorubellus sp. JP-L1 TaxID=2715753 RepID=UPI001407DE46|nr:hypothetical protein [Halorubellus sp. JP-L1]NHN41856.1 hypothetical protein [Halorubellus sp. JP-L1]
MSPQDKFGSTPYDEEREVANKVLRAIDLAIEDEIESLDRRITRLEQEKLCYFAIEEFNLPITYSWYVEGAYTRVAGDPDGAVNRITADSPNALQDPGEDDDVNKFREFFRSTEFFGDYKLRDIWYTNRYEFLKDFYKAESPSDFTDLYISSTNIRQQLSEISKSLATQNKNRSLAEFTDADSASAITDDVEQEFRLSISDFHLELASIEKFEDLMDVLSQSTNILEHILARLTELDSPSESQEAVVADLNDYFYYGVWRFPALYISARTATGPNSHHLIDEHVREFESFHGEFVPRVKRMESQAKQESLLPDAGSHSKRLKEGYSSYLHNLTKESLERDA